MSAGQILKLHRRRNALSQMALAVRIGVTLPAVSGWERDLYRPRRPTAQRLDDELSAAGAILAAFGYAPLPRASDDDAGSAEDRVERLEALVSELSARIDELQGVTAETLPDTTRRPG